MSGYRFDRLRILVVDDNAQFRKLVATMLRAFGVVHVTEAGSATHAWQILREVNPDIILLDWIMDGVNGIEFAKMVRNEATSPNPFVPIIMISGVTQHDRVGEARDAGINEFLAKPISVTGLMARLLSVIENPRPFVRTKSYFGPSRRRRDTDDYQGAERRTASTAPIDTNAMDAVA